MVLEVFQEDLYQQEQWGLQEFSQVKKCLEDMEILLMSKEILKLLTGIWKME